MPEHTPAPTPHRAIYGYAFYLLVFSLFAFYFLWALLPTKEWGLTYLPDKYFAILLPMLVLVGLSFFAFFIYPAVNMSLTPEIDEMASVVDVNLIIRGKSRQPIQSWEDIQQELEQPKLPSPNVENKIFNCRYCLGNHHKHEVSTQIDTLRFIDLAEVNRELF